MRKRINRRCKARIACMLVLQFRPRDAPASPWRSASVLDLTEAGCRVRVAFALAGGTPLLLRFDALLHDGATSATLEAPARVMWCRRQGPSAYELGIEFAGAPRGLSEILGVLDSV